MANYHILNGRADGNQLRVVFHLPVPDTINAVETGYRAALLAYLGSGSIQSAVPDFLLGVGEQDALDAGQLYEHVWMYNTRPGATLSQKRDELDAKFTQLSSVIIAQLQPRLEFYGYSRDVT